MNDFLSDYKARMSANGTTIGEQQFNNTAYFIEQSFANSPFYRVAIIESSKTQLEIRIQDMSIVTRSNTIETVQFTMKFAFLKPNNKLNLGEIIFFDDLYWIVTDFNSDNPLYPKAKLFMCNYTLPVVTGTTKVKTGTDSLGRPVYSTQNAYSYLHCFVRSYMTNSGLNQAINLPSDTMYITLKYDDISKLIKEDDQFVIYDRTYKVTSIDFSNTLDKIGLISLMVARVTNTSS